MGKSQKCSSAATPVDRISKLPDSLICCVLSFLPTKFAVATSILSRRWKFLWTGVTALDFDDGGDKTEGGGDTRMSFAQFVGMVLLYIDTKDLNKFRLKWMQNCNPVYFTMWVSFAVAQNIKVLTLHMRPADKRPGNGNGGLTAYFQLPDSLFTCGTLEFLSLEGHILVRVPSYVCLPKLEVLKLCLVSYGGDEPFERLISGCPVLHSLRISGFFSHRMVGYRISSPSLKCLEIFNIGSRKTNLPLEIDAPAVEFFVLDDPLWQGCSVKRLSSLRRAILDVHGSFLPSWAVELLGALNRVNHLTLKGEVLMSLSNATFPIFERLTELDIYCNVFQWSSLNVMLGNSIKLKVLNIKAIGRGPWKDPEGVPECLLSSLERVSFRGYINLGDGIKMVEYILKHGALLKLFHLEYPGNCYMMNDLQKKLQMLQEISMFPRCSRSCRIKFD